MAYWKAMDWQIVVDTTTGIRVYRLAGVLTDSLDAPKLIEVVRSDLRYDPRAILLDLSEVEMMTSAGVGMVAAIHASASNAGKLIALTGLNHRVRQILQIVRLLQFIPAFEDEQQALAAHASGGWEVHP